MTDQESMNLVRLGTASGHIKKAREELSAAKTMLISVGKKGPLGEKLVELIQATQLAFESVDKIEDDLHAYASARMANPEASEDRGEQPQ